MTGSKLSLVGELWGFKNNFGIFNCACGGWTLTTLNNWRKGNSTTCGCSRGTHKKSGTPEYMAWQNMKQRCLNPNWPQYHNYGGRGILISPKWAASFEAFYADMGPRPGPGYELDRIDNSQGYSPDNCRWVIEKDNHRNKRSNLLIEFQGQQKCLSAWAEDLGISRNTLAKRLKKWGKEKALTTPRLAQYDTHHKEARRD